MDKAVLVLAASYADTRSLIDIFYYERPLGVTTGSLIVINKDRVSAQLAEAGKGGGGGGGGGGPEVREEFPDTAFWRADFVSDENGVIEFAVKLPDNLTTWVLTAKGVNAETQVGEAADEIVATKPLQVRPALPRFFTVGDRAQIGGVVLNGAPAAMTDGEFPFDASGAAGEDRDTTGTFTLAAQRDDFDLHLPGRRGDDAVERGGHHDGGGRRLDRRRARRDPGAALPDARDGGHERRHRPRGSVTEAVYVPPEPPTTAS